MGAFTSAPATSGSGYVYGESVGEAFVAAAGGYRSRTAGGGTRSMGSMSSTSSRTGSTPTRATRKTVYGTGDSTFSKPPVTGA